MKTNDADEFIQSLMLHADDDRFTITLRDTKDPLTPEELDAMEPDTIFQVGETLIEHPWFNDAKGNLGPDGRSVRVKYVVLRGGIGDYKIYHSLDANLERSDYLDGTSHLERSWQDVCKHGASMHRESDIRRIVNATDAAFERYRH
jgi:hypothetical protein